MARATLSEIRQQELIEAVIDAIYKDGFANLTVAKIAARAETSTGSIHYYFGGKDALMEATMRRLLSILRSVTLRRLAMSDSPLSRLHAVVGANFDPELFTQRNCSVWTQFWGQAPYFEQLARLQRINKARVRANLSHNIRSLVPSSAHSRVLDSIAAYMDGIWVDMAQKHQQNPDTTFLANKHEENALAFVDKIITGSWKKQNNNH